MGGRVSVQWLPHRALCTIEEFCEDLWIGTCENDDILLRPNSRATTSVLCVVWWRVVREGANLRIYPSRSDQSRRVDLRPFVVNEKGMVHFYRHSSAWCPETNRCVGIVSKTGWIIKSDNVDGTLVWHVGDWFGQQAIGVLNDRFSSIMAVSHASRVVAATDTHLLLKTPCIADDWLPPPGRQGTRLVVCTLTQPSTHIRLKDIPSRDLIAAHLVDDSTACYVTHMRGVSAFEVSVVNKDEVFSVGTLCPQQHQQHDGAHTRKLSHWNSILVPESPGQFVFVMLATFYDDHHRDSIDVCYLVRFRLERRVLVVLTSWINRHDTCLFANDFCEVSRMNVSVLQVPPSHSSVIALHITHVGLHGSQICFFDRVTLRNFSQGIACTRETDPYTYTLIKPIVRIQRDPAVAVVARCIEHSKEAARNRKLYQQGVCCECDVK
jgi:hypothetical protein